MLFRYTVEEGKKKKGVFAKIAARNLVRMNPKRDKTVKKSGVASTIFPEHDSTFS